MTEEAPKHGKPAIVRVGTFCGFAYGIAGLTALAIFRTGGLADSASLIPGTPVTVAAVLLPTAYMFAPGLAHVLTRLVSREGWNGLWLRPHFRTGWQFLLAGWWVPIAATIAGGAVFFVLLSGYFDPTLSGFSAQLSAIEERSGQPVPLDPAALFAIQTVSAILVAPLINSLFAFGEEFGWRGYLQPALLSALTPRAAMPAMGVIWGLWHAPLIAMGYNYGTGYPGFPWAGILLFCWFTFCTGTLLGWLAYRGGSIWPGVLGHGTLNAVAGLTLALTQGDPPRLLGPMPMGIIGGIGFSCVAVWILWRWREPRGADFALTVSELRDRRAVQDL